MSARRYRALGLILCIAIGFSGTGSLGALADETPAATQAPAASEEGKSPTPPEKKEQPKPQTSEESKAAEASKPAEKEASKPAEKPEKPSPLSRLLQKAAAKVSGDSKAKPEAKKDETKEPEAKDEPKTPKPDKPEAKEAKPAAEKPAAEKPAAEKPEPKTPDETQAKEEKKPTKRVRVVQLVLRGEYPEGPTTMGPFGELQPSLPALMKKFEQLAEDKDVAAVLLEVDQVAVGAGKVHEIRQAIGRLRKAGKPVYAMITSAEGGQYLIACACDEIVIIPPGIISIPGVRMEVTFYKGLLDKIGVQAEILRMGKYKGAAEPPTRTGMSEPLRESYEAVVNDRYEQLVAEIARDRKLKDYQVRTHLDQGLFTAADAKKAGLVDQVAYVDQFLVGLKKRMGADELFLVTKYKSRDRSAEFSGMSGMMKLFQVMLGGSPTTSPSRGNKIAVIYAVGPIMQGKSSSSLFGGDVLGSTTMVETLREAEKDPTVKAIVFRGDSPGGSAIASDLIWREMVRIKKPIIASMGDVAGSGGYYISVGADKIFAAPATLTGSIGVVGGKIVTKGLFDKIGLSTEGISRGQHSGIFSSETPFSPSEREALQALMREFYRQFVAKSAQGRKMPFEKLHELAQGRIYTGNMAVANGLVDKLGTLEDAIAEAKRAAKLPENEKVEILMLPRPKSIFEQLFGDPSATADEQLTELIGPIVEVQLLRRLFAEGVLTLMPGFVELK